MIRIERVVVDQLLAYVDLAAQIQDRVYPVIIKQGAKLPAVVFTSENGQDMRLLSGQSTLGNRVFSFEVWGESYDKVRAICELVQDALVASTQFRVSMDREIDSDFGEERELYSASFQASIWYTL